MFHFLLNHLKLHDIFCNFIPITMCVPDSTRHQLSNTSFVVSNSHFVQPPKQHLMKRRKKTTETPLKPSCTVAEQNKKYTIAKQTNDGKTKFYDLEQNYFAVGIQRSSRRWNTTKIEINYTFDLLWEVKRPTLEYYPFQFFFLISQDKWILWENQFHLESNWPMWIYWCDVIKKLI